MLRNLRIIGIIVFAVLVGISAHRLHKLYRSGSLFEEYNSERRASVTLLLSSIAGLGVLGYLEIFRPKRKGEPRGFSPMKVDEEPVDDGLDTASIYAAPETIDKWHRRSHRTSRSERVEKRRPERFWLGLLRILSFSTPVVYTLLFVACLLEWIPMGLNPSILAGLFGFMLVFSILSAVGIMRKKAWGISIGYAIAIIHLLFFPLGTAAGLFLLVGLMGATPAFAESRQERWERRREARKKRQRKKKLGVA